MVEDQIKPYKYPVGPDEKVANIMTYTISGVSWGEVVVKEVIRPSTWLRTNSAPDNVCLYNARTLIATAGGTPKSLAFPELHLMTSQILAYHLIPPAKDPLDYDPSEPNRKMDEITVLFGSFRIDGKLRLSTRTDLARFLEVTRESYTALYDADISSPIMPALSVMHVPYVQVRQAACSFANRAV